MSSSGGFCINTFVASEKRHMWRVPFVSPSIREAAFTVSPMIVYSRRRSEPTFPATNAPLWMPMPIRNPSPSPCSCRYALKRGRRVGIISFAVATARSAWSGCSIGAPKTAMIPSPE